MKPSNTILSLAGGASLLFGCQTARVSLQDEVNNTLVQTRTEIANVNTRTNVNYEGLVALANRASIYLAAISPVNSAIGTSLNLGDVRSALETDLAVLEHGLRGARGRVYVLLNGYRSLDGVAPVNSSNAERRFWLYGTQMSTQELADAVAGANTVLDSAEAVDLVRTAQTQFTPIPEGRITHHDRLADYGWVVLPQVGSRNLDLRLADFITRYGLTTSSYDGRVGGPSYTHNDLRLMRTDGNPTRLHPDAPFAIQLVIEEAPIGTPIR